MIETVRDLLEVEKPKILIVDDKQENLVALTSLLRDLPVEIVKAHSGNKALALSLEHEFALMLIDVQMPDMDGFETVELMRQEDSTRSVPVIFVSAVYSGDYYKIKGIESGAVDFLEKPIVPELLLGKVRIFLEMYQDKAALRRLNAELEDKVKKRTELLEKISRTDTLTGMYNRFHFMELLRTELERSRRHSRVFCLLMFDLDHFKRINDTLGHAAGDEALRSLALVFQTSGLRSTDFYGRIGGEEFSLVLPETNIEGAVTLAERLRARLEKSATVYDGKEFYITASIGVCQYTNKDTIESLLDRADQAMYRAKETGRNRVFRETLSTDKTDLT